MDAAPDPDRAPGSTGRRRPAAPPEFRIPVPGRPRKPEEDDPPARILQGAMLASVSTNLALPFLPEDLLLLVGVGLGPFVLITLLYCARVLVVRARARNSPPVTSMRVRVVRREDRTGVRTEEVRDIIPGARPVSLRAGRPDPTWPAARDRFARLRGEYADFECDPMQVLHLPALTDATMPSTARFIDAFADAQALATDHYPGPEHARQFITAAAHAERTWRAARDAAERIRLSGLTPAERTTVERVLKLLTTARDTDSEPERLAAYSRARTELTKLDRAGVVHLPRPARAALDEAARKQLPPG